MSNNTAPTPPAGRGSVELKVSADSTGGAMSVHLQTLPPGAETLTHIHHNCEETVYPVVGSPTVTIEGIPIELGSGDTAVVPRGKRHAIANNSTEDIQFLFITTPGGIEGFFDESKVNQVSDAAMEQERVKAIAMKYGVEVLRPTA